MQKINDKSILLISHELSNTGAPILCRRISEQLRADGYSTVIISLCKGKITEVIRSAADEVKVVNIRHSYIKKALRMFNPKWGQEKSHRLNYLIRHYRKKGYGKVIVNSMESGSIVPYLNKQGYKVLTLVHEMSSVYDKFNAYDKLDNIAKYSHDIVFPSNPVKEDFMYDVKEEVKAKVHLFPQGCYKKSSELIDRESARINVAKKLNIPENSRFLVGSGAMDIIKGFDFVPLILDNLREYDNLNIVWLGEKVANPYTVNIKHQIKRMGLDKRIHLLGFITDNEEYNNILQGSEAFILTSREDPMPSVMAEAILMKTPVVAFLGSGGAEELLAEGRGYLSKYCDIDDYCKKIRVVLRNGNDVKETVENAYKYVKDKLVFEDYVRRLESILNNKKEG